MKRARTRSLGASPADDPAVWSCLKEGMELLACERDFKFDERGDLTLRVGNSKENDCRVYHLVVCSRSLARRSRVFSAMLFSNFAESRPISSGPWRVDLPEDDISALFIVLSILHGHFQYLPKTLSQQELYQLLVLTEKYDMTQVLKPWVSAWFRPFNNGKVADSTEAKAVVMWISWELGHEETFRRYVMDLLRNSKIDSEGRLLSWDRILLDTYIYLKPPGILESIAQTRKDVIQKITGLLYSAIEDQLTRDTCTSKQISGHNVFTFPSSETRCRMEPKECICLVLGSLIRAVTQIGLGEVALLRTATPHYAGSINELSSLIGTLSTIIHDKLHHNPCNPLPEIKNKVRKLIGTLECPVTDIHLKYLRNQAKKTGV